MTRGREEYPTGGGLGIHRAGGQAGCPQRDGAGVGHVWTGVGRYGQVWAGMDRYGQVWAGMDRYGQVWAGMGRYGQVWTGMSRYGQACDDGAGEGGAQGSADSHLPPPSEGETWQEQWTQQCHHVLSGKV